MAATPLAPSEIEALTEVLRTLGHDTRLRLIDALRVRGEQSVGDLETLTGIGQPGLSQQLAILRKAELVKTRRAAKQVYYRIDPDALATTAGFLAAIAGVETSAARDRETLRHRGSAAVFAKLI